VQHQFEDTYWTESNGWDYTSAAMQEVPTISCRKFYSGSRAILDFIISIISVQKSQTIFLKNVIKKIRFFKSTATNSSLKFAKYVFKIVG
jgi:hypothetical protein